MIKKKILITVPSFDGGGAERVIINIANNLNKNIFDVYLMVIDGSGPYKNNVSKDIVVIDLESHRLRYAIKKIISVVNEVSPQVILSTLGHLNIAILALRMMFKSKPKIIVRLANTPSQLLKNMKKSNKFLLKQLIEMFYGKADLIIAQCVEMKNDFLNSFEIENPKIKHIYNPIDIDNIRASITNQNPFNPNTVNFLGVGRLTHQKGFDILIKSFKLVVEEIPNAELTILGTGISKNEYLTLAEELNIAEKVRFLGFTDNPYNYYYYSDVYVLSSRFEGFPNSLLEALACRTKVVATNCQSGPTEILENRYGVMADVADINSLADAMLIAYNKNNTSSNRAEYYDIDKIIKDYEKIIIEVMIN